MVTAVKRLRPPILALAAIIGLCAAPWMPVVGWAEPNAAPSLLGWGDLLSRPLPLPTVRVPYGPLPDQFGELWLPAGKGPFPVVVMVHGGCWRSTVAKLSIMNYVAEDLRARGVAVWNLEYRGVDRPGGGYPGTFADVGMGADALRGLARRYPLRLDHVTALGHSAGGHLVFWLAARGRIAGTSPLRAARPLPITTAISLGGLPDLAAARAAGDAACGAAVIDSLVGPPTASRPDVYADTSPAVMGSTAARGVLINGEFDTLAPPSMGRAYVERLRPAGQRVRQTTIAGMGHVELITPGTAAWSAAIHAILATDQPVESGLLRSKPLQ